MHKETVRFILLNVILLACFTLNTLYLELIYKNEINITNYLVFYSSVYNYIVAVGFSYKNTLSNDVIHIPHYQYAVISLGTFISSQTGMFALDYISMPTYILLKSCKFIPTFVVGVINGKSYPLYKFISIVALSSGTYFYMYTDNNYDPVIGLGFASASLISDIFVSIYQEALVKKYQIQTIILMQNIQMWRIVFSFCYIQDWFKFIKFIHQYSTILIFLGLSGAGTQVCLLISLNLYDNLTCSMMDNFRKVFNIILSILLNKYSLTDYQYFGLTLGISGILINFTYNQPFFSQKIYCRQCMRRIKNILSLIYLSSL